VPQADEVIVSPLHVGATFRLAQVFPDAVRPFVVDE
jgi:hypothetical protein